MGKIYFIFCCVFLSSCAVQKSWVAVGGSKSDNIVKLSYEYRVFERPFISEQQGLNEAKGRCVVWGYSDAKVFGGSIVYCSYYSSDGSYS